MILKPTALAHNARPASAPPRQAALGSPAQGFVERMPGLSQGIRTRVARPSQEAPPADRRQLPLVW